MSSTETKPNARTVASTQSEMTEIILPNDTNTLGNLLGGRLMHFIDLTGAMAAYRHARTYIVTAAMDHIDFIRPVRLGDLLTLKSSVNRAFSTSMEMGVKVWAEHPADQRPAACGQRLPGVCGHRRKWTAGARAGAATGDCRRAAPLRRRAAAPRSIARPRRRGANRRSWPTLSRKARKSENRNRRETHL